MDPRFNALGEEADGLAEQVEAAFEEHAPFATLLATRVKVDDLARRFRELLYACTASDREIVERTIGRKMLDLQRMAIKLPQPPAGQRAEKPASRDFMETRAPSSSRPPVNPGLQPGETRREKKKLGTTDEIESWCGPCSDLRTHVIVAMVGDAPAQVACKVCKGLHKYRAAPPKEKPAAKQLTYAGKPYVDPDAQRRAKEKQALLDAIQSAEAVRPFTPRDRYKPGEVIQHPEHGRGKIENVLPRSMLVRFTNGLRSVKLG